MEVDRPRSDSGRDGKKADLGKRARRPQPKDQLLGENPPRALSAAILLIAALLGAAVMAARNIEYQETIPISLVLKEDELPGSAYGIGWLPQSQAAKVKPNQLTLIELASPTGADNMPIEGQVHQVTMAFQDSMYQVRVKLPANFNSDPERTRILRQGAQAQGRIVTWRGKLFRRMFTVFSNL
jgi:hypothetical protein